MKKYNEKMRAYSDQKVRDSKTGIIMKFIMVMFIMFSVTSMVVANNVKDVPISTTIMAGGSTLAGMALIGNIEDQPDAYTQPNQIAYEIGLVALDQIDGTVAFPVPNASREVGAITLKAGELAHKFYSHNAPTLSSTGEKSDYTVTPKKEFQLVLANAFRDNVLNFVEQYAGGKFIVFFRQIETTQWYIFGSYDKPVTFQSYELKQNDANVCICKFSHDSLKQYFKATTPSFEVPVTVAADATNLAISGSSVYQLTDNTGAKAIATISGVASADVGRQITVLGSGGDNPTTIADNTVFVLANGTTWTGNAGSSINFRILDTTSLVEISRVQTA
jgi:hypothetical protein